MCKEAVALLLMDLLSLMRNMATGMGALAPGVALRPRRYAHRH
jgi:hypothetical protein